MMIDMIKQCHKRWLQFLVFFPLSRWRRSKAHDELLGGHALKRNLVHLLKQRVAVRPLARHEERVHLLGSRCTLQLLPVQQPCLDLRERFASLDKRFRAFSNDPSVWFAAR